MNNFSNINNNSSPNNINCKYYDVTSFSKLNKIKNKISMFHLNIASLNKHKDELVTLLEMMNHSFDFIGLIETKIKYATPASNIELNGYTSFSTPTCAEKGGAILYVKDHFSTKRRTDLEKILYKPKELESVFIEIVNKNKPNYIIASIYRHPSMELDIFNKEYLSPLLLKLERCKKKLLLAGDFNIDLLKADSNSSTSDFFDLISSNLLSRHIIQPTRYSSHGKTLIYNIFSNWTNIKDICSGNLTASLSDHLPQFIIIENENVELKDSAPKFSRDFKNFNAEDFILDFLSIDFVDISNKADLNNSFNSCLDEIDKGTNQHLPLRKLTKKETKTRSKPWITLGLRKSIHRRDCIYRSFIKEKDVCKKKNLNQTTKHYEIIYQLYAKKAKNYILQNFSIKIH